jgi:NADPH:quinone reductase-like Zn-dependent oxidoreductase
VIHSYLTDLWISGARSEYAKCPERYIALKPKNLSFDDTAALPLAGVTALQVLKKYEGSLEGKTVFIPSGCKLHLPLLGILIKLTTSR